MQRSTSILSDGHVYNSPRRLDPTDSGTPEPNLKHSSISNESKELSINTSDHDNNASTTSTSTTTSHLTMEDSDIPDELNTLVVDSLVRTLDESLKDPGEHCISTHDIVEAYNMLSMKIRNCSPDMAQDPTSTVTPPSMFEFSEDESTTIFNCLMRDIGRVSPSLFETQPKDDSFADLSTVINDEDDFQEVIENSLVCQYALTLASDILVHSKLQCNFTEDQLAVLFRYILSICTAKDSTKFNMEKHIASALFILKVQKLPLSVLTSLKDSIASALRCPLSEEARNKYGEVDALKVIPVFLREHPTCISWFTSLVPTILKRLNSENPEISLSSAWALASFASAKMRISSVPQPPDPQITNAIKFYVQRETSVRLPSAAANSFHSFFKAGIQNDPKWGGLGPSFSLTVIATLVVLLDHTLFSIPECLKSIFLLLGECVVSKLQVVRSGQREVWKTVFWAFSRIPRSSDVSSNSEIKSKKERAFRVVAQDLRGKMRLDLLDFLLRPDEVGTESNRSENDVSRAIELVSQLFEKRESSASRLQGISILSRMVASIGSSSIAPWHREPGELPFACQILDGSFLLKGTADFTPVHANILIERLHPLTEMEVLRHWDAICATWVSIVQNVLNCSGEISSPIQQIWQALLLVKADVQGQQLSSSSLFSSTITSIIQTFSAKLDSIDSELCYLSCIKKLWAVMRNVFQKSWLSLPGEKILAMLLKHQFTLSDDRVKESWSQVCADLISVGVPDLLRLLHLRDENREEEEITRQLWVVLAKNDSTVTDKENPEALLDLLLMPFSTWDLDSTDCITWERLFLRICALGNDKRQSSDDIVSSFLSRCSEPKLDSLKKSPRVLRFLLEQSTPSSCSRASLQILSWIDDNLSRAYGIAAEKSCALESLRLIGKVIANTGESDIVNLLCVVQQSLTLWIADEEEQLDEQEDPELVDALYAKSLEVLSRVEPSITILHDLEKFLHSVFLRIRGQGPLAFLNFWRSTYHTRKDVPKREYPPLIRQCLKAWADVTENSFGDGFSLDSGSQSLRSYTIPDSQLEDADVDQMDFDLDPFLDKNSTLLITAHDYSGEPLSHGSATPIAGHRSMGVEESFTPALVDSSGYDGHCSMDAESKMISVGSVASSSKRRAESTPRTPKRPRTTGPQNDTPDYRKKGKAKADDFEDSIESYANSASNDSPSRALDRTSSHPSHRSKTSSQLSRSYKKRKRSDSPASMHDESRPFGSLHAIRSSPQAGGYRTSEDYDAWEQPMSASDLELAKANARGSSDPVVPDSEELRKVGGEQRDEEGEQTDHVESDDHDILSPSLGEYPLRSRVRERSQTAPELEHPQTFSPPPASRSLRRNRTTQEGLEHKKTSSAQLDVLQRAYAVVADTGASQVDVQDIMQAKRLLNQINLVLDEQMCLKVGSSTRRNEGKDKEDTV